LNLTSSYPVTSLSGNQKLHLQHDATHNDGGRIRRTTTTIVTIVASVVAATTPSITIAIIYKNFEGENFQVLYSNSKATL